MNRILHFVITFLILLSAPVGTNVHTAVFDSSSNDVKVFSVYTSAQEINPVCFSETKIIERIQVRPQKKSSSVQSVFDGCFLAKSGFSFLIPSFSKLTLAKARVLLLPKSIQNIIFIQTVV